MQLITESPRLSLRTWTMNDLPAGLRLWGDSQVMKYITLDGQGESEEKIASSLHNGILHQEKYHCQHWAVILKEQQELIGCCGFNIYKQNESQQELELVFHFIPSCWGKGYASEAAQAALEYAQRNLSFTKIVASVHPQNTASLKILEKLGFVSQGSFFYEDSGEEEIFYTWEKQ